jgi:leucyl/phenylalanyl-tRNA--protein transferase
MIDPDLLVSAYASGWFPMAVESGEIRWFSPDPRGVLPLDRFHASSRLLRVRRQARFTERVDGDFDAVIRACASAERDPADPGTWISEEIVASYNELHRRGAAHSVEAWRDGVLAGGLYGVALGGVFFGESMFHRETDASKVALVALVERLRARGYQLLDTQWMTPHLRRFGGIEIPRKEYLRRLHRALAAPCTFA